MASLINAVMVLATMLFLAALFTDLPGAALGAVVIDAMVGLITLADGRRYYRINRADWTFFVAAGLGILFFGIITGIVIGVVLSLLLLITRASNPGVRVLGKRPGSDAYLDVTRHEGLATTPGIIVVRIDGPLFFANANRFRDTVRELVAAAAEPVRALVIDAEAISQTDTDGADILTELAHELGRRKITLALARVESRISDLWERAGALEAVGTPVFHTTSEAVEALSRARARD
jgi:MFS superfamily sulfate permease-like transporter